MFIASMTITIKTTILKTWNFILPAVVFFFDPNQAKLMLALFTLIALDTLGWAYYNYNLDKYNNKKFWTGAVGKILKYFSAIAAARILEYFLIGIPYSQDLDIYVMAVLAVTEFKSFYTCLRRFGINIPILPKIEKIIDNLDVDKKG